MGERRDCLDQRWVPLLESVDILPIPLPNKVADVNHFLSEIKLDGLILTGGNDLSKLPNAINPAPERDRFETLAMDYSKSKNLPVLGVCRGMQMMGDYYNATLLKVMNHAGLRHLVQLNENFLDWSPAFEVNSYHNYSFKTSGLGSNLNIIAAARDETVEAFRHKALPHYGIMWHPERESAYRKEDLELLTAIFFK